MTTILVNLLVSVMAAATPLLLAAVGELVVERVAVLNLGVEGMMLVGAIAGFATAHETGNLVLALCAALAAGMLLSSVFALLTLTLQANQTATGLALTIFGRGFSSLVGARRLCRHRPPADLAASPYPRTLRPARAGAGAVRLRPAGRIWRWRALPPWRGFSRAPTPGSSCAPSAISMMPRMSSATR